MGRLEPVEDAGDEVVEVADGPVVPGEVDDEGELHGPCEGRTPTQGLGGFKAQVDDSGDLGTLPPHGVGTVLFRGPAGHGELDGTAHAQAYPFSPVPPPTLRRGGRLALHGGGSGPHGGGSGPHGGGSGPHGGGSGPHGGSSPFGDPERKAGPSCSTRQGRQAAAPEEQQAQPVHALDRQAT